MSMLNHLKKHKYLVLRILTALLLCAATALSVFVVMLSLNTALVVIDGKTTSFKTSKQRRRVLAFRRKDIREYGAGACGNIIAGHPFFRQEIRKKRKQSCGGTHEASKK